MFSKAMEVYAGHSFSTHIQVSFDDSSELLNRLPFSASLNRTEFNQIKGILDSWKCSQDPHWLLLIFSVLHQVKLLEFSQLEHMTQRLLRIAPDEKKLDLLRNVFSLLKSSFLLHHDSFNVILFLLEKNCSSALMVLNALSLGLFRLFTLKILRKEQFLTLVEAIAKRFQIIISEDFRLLLDNVKTHRDTLITSHQDLILASIQEEKSILLDKNSQGIEKKSNHLLSNFLAVFSFLPFVKIRNRIITTGKMQYR